MSFMKVQSVCEECGRPVQAEYIRRDQEVYLEKNCPEHGASRALASEDADAFERWIAFPSVTIPPRVFLSKGAKHKGDGSFCVPGDSECPLHCGPCENHLMTACCVLLNVTDRCNQRCPWCFAEAKHNGDGSFCVDEHKKNRPRCVDDPPISEIGKWLDRLIELGEERKFNIQLSGGEPTVRDDLSEIIALCKKKEFEYTQLNTNGRKLAEDPEYAKSLRAAGLSTVFLQFDGVDDDVYKALRGEPLFEIKKAAIRNCGDAGLPVTLVPTVLKNVNLSQTGAIIDFMLDNIRTVKGVHFQPASFFGRHEGGEGERVTMFKVMEEIEKQTNGRVKKADLAPISTGHPLCCFCAAYMKESDGELRPLRSGGSCCPEEPLEIIRRDRDFVLNKWEVSDPDAAAPEASSFDEALAVFKANMFTISGMAFMDKRNLDAERLRRCRVQVFSRDERLIPFCAYYSKGEK